MTDGIRKSYWGEQTDVVLTFKPTCPRAVASSLQKTCLSEHVSGLSDNSKRNILAASDTEHCLKEGK